jgi:hypothetical protein
MRRSGKNLSDCIKCVGNGDGGENDDTRCIVIVIVVEPQGAREYLKYVEWG